MLRLIVFDLDGTLADTLRDLAEAVNDALKQQGFAPYPVDDYRRFVGNGLDNLIRTVLKEHADPERVARAKEDFSAYYAAHCEDYTTAYPGMARLLDTLAADGIMTAVISNKPHAYVPGILSTVYPNHTFTIARGQQEGVARKPDPESLIKLLAELGVEKDEALYVGDSDVDVIFAHNAGLQVCGVSWGFRGAGELSAAGADCIVDTAEELKDRIYEST